MRHKSGSLAAQRSSCVRWRAAACMRSWRRFASDWSRAARMTRSLARPRAMRRVHLNRCGERDTRKFARPCEVGALSTRRVTSCNVAWRGPLRHKPRLVDRSRTFYNARGQRAGDGRSIAAAQLCRVTRVRARSLIADLWSNSCSAERRRFEGRGASRASPRRASVDVANTVVQPGSNSQRPV